MALNWSKSVLQAADQSAQERSRFSSFGVRSFSGLSSGTGSDEHTTFRVVVSVAGLGRFENVSGSRASESEICSSWDNTLAGAPGAVMSVGKKSLTAARAFFR